ncbi:hypothetical protein FACS189461_1060 [Spirochaetia bacterium]|nr:hypothetical protein FACS189461_1060 [Spirochaetia bacterium]
MDKIGLVDRVTTAVVNIALGRRYLAAIGRENEGGPPYHQGLTDAVLFFDEVYAEKDLDLMLLAERTFLMQELHSCDPADAAALSSAQQAVDSFADAFRALGVVRDGAAYKEAEKTYPRNRRNRVHGYPKDALHQACIAHKTRIGNALRTMGLNLTEKGVYQKRKRNLGTMQSVYGTYQKASLL